jgi:hypothetical protein
MDTKTNKYIETQSFRKICVTTYGILVETLARKTDVSLNPSTSCCSVTILIVPFSRQGKVETEVVGTTPNIITAGL